MTVCAAAIYTTEKTHGGLKHAVMGISDRMITSWGEIEYEPKNHTKIFAFSIKPTEPTKIVALGAGDDSNDLSVSTMTQREMIGLGTVSVEEAADLYAKNAISLRNKHAEQRHLSPFGLDLKSFVDRQQSLARNLVDELSHRVQGTTMGIETIITGVDADNNPHIFCVGGVDEFDQEDFSPICLDRRGFASVGIGFRQFETLFMSSGYDTTWEVMDTMLLMYSAKKRAEASPGIGRLTDMFIIDENGFRLLSEESGKIMEAYYKEFDKAVEKKRLNIVEKMQKDKDRLLQYRTGLVFRD